MDCQERNDRFLDESLSFDILKKEISSLLSDVFGVDLNDIMGVEPVVAGTSNFLYLSEVRLPSKESKKFLIRINGKGTDELISREKEKVTLHAFGKVKCFFRNGIVYDYINGMVLNHVECRSKNHQRGIATLLAKTHSKQVDYPENFQGIVLIELFNKWYEKYVERYSSQDEKYEYYTDKERMKKEIQFVTGIFTKYFSDTVLFCHNDLSSPNVIYDPIKEEHHFIDFEYAGNCFRGFDIGDHWSEYAGLALEDYVPSDDIMKRFIKVYVSEWKKQHGEDDHKMDMDENRLFVESYLGYTSAQLFWGLWAFIMSTFHAEIHGFDYFEFGIKRMKNYYRDKKRLLILMKEHDPKFVCSLETQKE